MRHIYQRHATSCFPTCIAIVSGISYDTALKLVHPFHKKWSSYATLDDWGIKVLRLLDFRVRKRYPKDFTKLKEVAIISIATDENNKHVVVWDPETKKVLDPASKYLPISFYKRYFEYALLLT